MKSRFGNVCVTPERQRNRIERQLSQPKDFRISSQNLLTKVTPLLTYSAASHSVPKEDFNKLQSLFQKRTYLKSVNSNKETPRASPCWKKLINRSLVSSSTY